MRTRLMILAIVLGCITLSLSIAILLAAWLGFAGVGIWVSGAALLIIIYERLIRPWHQRWGTRDEELARVMPGDDIVPNAHSTTRAISIDKPPEAIWPWLVQIGYGRAGWYSYDWIDNDGRPSAGRIIPQFQGLKIGDQIVMVPEMGPTVTELVSKSYFVATDDEGGTWCLAIYEDGVNRSRLVSRWRQAWKADDLPSRFFILIADAGAFIMEQKMLRVIKQRAEKIALSQSRIDTDSSSAHEEVA